MSGLDKLADLSRAEKSRAILLCLQAHQTCGLAGTFVKKAILYREEADEPEPWHKHTFASAAAFSEFLRNFGVAGVSLASPTPGPAESFSSYTDIEARLAFCLSPTSMPIRFGKIAEGLAAGVSIIQRHLVTDTARAAREAGSKRAHPHIAV